MQLFDIFPNSWVLPEHSRHVFQIRYNVVHVNRELLQARQKVSQTQQMLEILVVCRIDPHLQLLQQWATLDNTAESVGHIREYEHVA